MKTEQLVTLNDALVMMNHCREGITRYRIQGATEVLEWQ